MANEQTLKNEELIIEIQELRNQLNETKKLLSEKLTFYESLLDNSHDVTVRWNFQTNTYDYVSPSVESLVGYLPDEFINMDNDTALTMVHPEDISILKAGYKQSEDLGKSCSEYRQRTKTGEYVWVSNHMSVVRGINGSPLYRISNLRDISENECLIC